MAFGVKDANDGYPRHDPRYVEFAPILEKREANETRSTYYPLSYHKCTPEEYKNFHKFNAAQDESIREDIEEDFYYCINRTDSFGDKIPFELWGSDENMAHANIGIYYRPCIPIQLGEEGSVCQVFFGFSKIALLGAKS